MKNQDLQKKNGKKTSGTMERSKNRWLMVLLDSVLYLICSALVFGLSPSVEEAPALSAILFYAVAGYVLFFGFRFALNCYKQIWRYGVMRAFAREIAAGLLGAVSLVSLTLVLSKLLQVVLIPVTMPLILAAVYAMVSITLRVGYFYLYNLSQREAVQWRALRFLIEKLARVKYAPEPEPEPEPESEQPILAPINEIKAVAEKFAIHGNITKIKQINKGYINRTYRVETLSEAGHVHKYILQRINTNVFPDVDALMENYRLTTDHLHDKLTLPGHHRKGTVQMVRATKDGEFFLHEPSGYWRLMTYFDGVYSMDLPDAPETFYQAGYAFGQFLKEMSDVDASRMKIVIPNFHNTKSRYNDLEASIAKDPKKRVKDVTGEIAFIRERADTFGMISDALDSGKIPLRICHNDCNLNNLLFDKETHLPVAIIDLDTVMPSSPLYDFGDSMRIGTNTAKDDEKDLSKVSCNLHLYEQYARGYLEACGDVLTREELELLPYAALIITAEDGIRFLMDYIDGDTYYTIYYPDQNLDRARTQLKLLEDMEAKLPKIKQILRNIYTDLGLQAQID